MAACSFAVACVAAGVPLDGALQAPCPPAALNVGPAQYTSIAEMSASFADTARGRIEQTVVIGVVVHSGCAAFSESRNAFAATTVLYACRSTDVQPDKKTTRPTTMKSVILARFNLPIRVSFQSHCGCRKSTPKTAIPLLLQLRAVDSPAGQPCA